MKIQGILDLSGFELQNFCIQNYTDKANVANLGRGRKFFFTGNSTDQDYHRELIYDGKSWRATAYLDDIDKINEKLDLIFGDELDTDTIIDSWKEVQDFLSGIEDTKNLMDLLNSKLDKTGGTITSEGMAPLMLSSTSSSGHSILQFSSGTTYYGALGFMAENTPYFRATNGAFNTLLHSGNVGDYTAGAANRLANKVSLWGNEFDGTQSLNGNIHMPNGYALYFITTNQEYISAVNMARDNVLTFGNGTNFSTRTLNTRVDGYNIYFRTGAKQTAMTITEEGNVNVGVNDADDYTFATKNALFAIGLQSTTPTTPKELDAENLFSLVNTSSSRYGLHAWILNGGSANIQSARADGVNDNTYALNLNPLGGAVNVGDGGLNVNGTIKSGDKFLLTTTSMNLGSATTPLYLFLVRPDANFIWASANGGYINLGVFDTGTTNSANATLSIYSDRVVSGQRNNAVSLGTSTYRWSNVYSVLGDFSDTVTIGKTGDGAEILRFNIERPWSFYQRATGGNTTLELRPSSIGKNFYISNPDGGVVFDFYCNGDESRIRSNALHQFNGGALIPTGQTLTIGSVTFRETAAGEVEVDGNLHTTGTLASGGKAAVGEGDNGGGGNANVYSDVLEGVITQEWEVGNPFQKEDVIVSLYMWNTDESRWEMVLADIGVTSENIWVTFGRPTSTTDKYMAVVMG